MRRIVFLLAVCILAAFAGAALAQTPDGVTPANETVCDVLIGATPGLYGLCVAFCEAQDSAALTEPVTQAELDELLESVPSGRILKNYNKKKKEGDPDMPCLVVQEPCPCLTEEQRATFGNKTGSQYNNKFCYDHINDAPNSWYTISYGWWRGYYSPNFWQALYVYDMHGTWYVDRYGEYFCQSFDYDWETNIFIHTPGFDITAEEAEACREIAVTFTGETCS